MAETEGGEDQAMKIAEEPPSDSKMEIAADGAAAGAPLSGPDSAGTNALGLNSRNVERKLNLSLDDLIKESQPAPPPVIQNNAPFLPVPPRAIPMLAAPAPPRPPASSRVGGRDGRRGPRMSIEDSSLTKTECVFNSEGVLSVKLHDTDVVTISKTDLTLNSGGWKTPSTFFVINEALRPLKLALDKAENGDWTVTDSYSYLQPFQDCMVVKPPSTLNKQLQAGRASVVMQHLQQRKLNAEMRKQQTQEMYKNEIARRRMARGRREASGGFPMEDAAGRHEEMPAAAAATGGVSYYNRNRRAMAPVPPAPDEPHPKYQRTDLGWIMVTEPPPPYSGGSMYPHVPQPVVLDAAYGPP